MIQKLPGFETFLEFNDIIKCFTLYSYNRIVIHPGQDLLLTLPYKRCFEPEESIKYYKCELIKEVAQKNLLITWNNLNDLESQQNLSFLLRNNNILLPDDINNLTKIVGTNKKIDILPSTKIIRIFVN